jgi:acetyltransferase-like isoleucine patch superfamily enzyme
MRGPSSGGPAPPPSAPEIDDDVRLRYPPPRAVSRPFHLGVGARLRSGTVLYDGSTIGDRLATGHHVVIREDCEIGSDVSVWSGSVIDYGCRIGDGVKIHTNCYVAQFTEIRDGAFLAPGVTLANDLYPGQDASARMMGGPLIDVGAQLGVNVTVLPYVHIGAGCLVGSGSVVTRDLPPGTVAFGCPAVVRGTVEALAPVSTRVAPSPASFSGFRVAHTAAGGGSDGR